MIVLSIYPRFRCEVTDLRSEYKMFCANRRTKEKTVSCVRREADGGCDGDWRRFRRLDEVAEVGGGVGGWWLWWRLVEVAEIDGCGGGCEVARLSEFVGL